MKLTFLGAADSVTGSRHLLDLDGQRLLLDCGLFQGYKALRERNWAGLGVAAASIDAVLLSHAHLDHSGYIPALRRQGFQGQVFCSPVRGCADAVVRAQLDGIPGGCQQPLCGGPCPRARGHCAPQ